MSSRFLAVAAAMVMVIAVIGVGVGGIVGTVRAATLVVDDDGVDCVGAGHTTIQSAVDSASVGDTIEVCSGTYDETVEIDIANVKLVANGSAVLDSHASKGVAFRVEAHDVWIEGFEMRNYTTHVVQINNEQGMWNRTTITNNVIWISGPGATNNNAGIGLAFGGSTGTTISNNAILDAPGGPEEDGIGMDLTTGGTNQNANTVIENNTITARNQGIRLMGGASGSVVRNNTLTIHEGTSFGSWGINLDNVRHVDVSENDVTVLDSDIVGLQASAEEAGNLTIENNSVDGGRWGILLDGTAGAGSANPNDPVVIRSNDVSNPADHGIRIFSVSGTELIDNAVTDPGSVGVILDEADNVTVAGNEITDPGTNGVVLDTANDLSVTGNRITGAAKGLVLITTQRPVVENNRLDGNVEGIRFGPATPAATVTANVITNGSTGIRIRESVSPALRDSRLRDNVISNVSSEGIFWDGDPPNSTVRNLTFDSAVVSFEAGDVVLQAVDTPPGDPVGKQNVGQHVEVTNLTASGFLNLTVNYTDVAAADVNESTLAMWAFNGTAWSAVPNSTVNASTNEVSADLTTFSTIAPLGTSDDTVSPQLLESTPADGDTDVTSDTDVTLRFDEPVQAGSGQLSLNATADDTVLDSVAIGSSDVTFDGANVTWTRTGDLPEGTDVYLYAPSGVILDAAGNAWPGIEDSTTLDFVTESDGTDDPSGDWPTFRHDEQNSGHNPDTIGLVANVTGRWNFTTGAAVDSSPAVVNGTVYVGSLDDDVYALNATDGTKRWNFTTGDGVLLSSPAVNNDTVYAGSQDRNLYALDAADGTERWTFDTGNAVIASPAVVDDTVYIASSHLRAIDAADGTERWNFFIGSTSRSSPAVVNDTVYVGSSTGKVFSLNATDGTERWNFTAGRAVDASPAVVDGTVYVGSDDNNVYALNATDGAMQWAFPTGDDVDSSPAVAGGTVYIGSADNNVYALNAEDGTERWRFTARNLVRSSPAVVNDTVYIGARDANVYALAASDGTERWNFTTGGAVRSSPAVVDGVVYVGSWDDKVYALAGDSPAGGDDSDTTPPVTSNLSVRVTDTRTISVSFDSNVSLDAIEAEVENQSGSVVETLETTDFGSVGTDPIEYVAQTTLDSAGTYTVTVTTAEDSAGNDGSSGEDATVQLVVEDVSIEHVNGTAPDVANLTSNVYLTQGSEGLLQVQLRDASDPTADLVNRSDLENLGVDPDTTLAVNVTLVGWTPRLVIGTGHNVSWTTTDVGGGVTTLNLTARPAETQLIESQLVNPGQPWPTGANDRADARMNATVDLAVTDMGFVADPAQRNVFEGAILATDAQTFGTPQYDPSTDTVSLFVGGPHLTVDGANNTGFFDAFLPDALLAEWGVTQPDDLTVRAMGEGATPTRAETVPGGVRLFVPIHYSEGEVEVRPAVGVDGGGTTGGASSSSSTGSASSSSGSTASDPTPTPTPTPTSTPESTTGPPPEETAEPTMEPTTEPTSTSEPTPTETSGQPGFDVVVALVALLGAGLLARRRVD